MPTDTPTDRAALEALAERMLDEGNGWGFKAAMVAQEAAATLRALAARVVELEAEVERLNNQLLTLHTS